MGSQLLRKAAAGISLASKIQRSAKKYATLAKQDPGRARQNN